MTKLIIDTSAKDTPEEKIAALESLVESTVFPDWEEKDGGMEIELINIFSAYRKMLLTNCSAGAELYKYEILGGTLSYSESKKQYTLALETKEEGKYYLRFNDIVFTESRCYNIVSAQLYLGNPWTHLVHIAFGLCVKAHYTPDLLNQKEKDILPVLQELKQIAVIDKDCKYEFPLLLNSVEKLGYTELKKRFDKVKTARIKEIALAELTNVLSFIKYKPLWDEIYNAVKESQSEYEPYILTDRSHEKVIDSVMKERGFCGTYPDYVKVSATKGIINESSYGEIYTITKEKNAVCRVRCQEIGDDDGEKQIVFLCGTAFFKGGHSCGGCGYILLRL